MLRMLMVAILVAGGAAENGFLMSGAANSCTSCTNVSACPAQDTACPAGTPYCVRHGADCVCKNTDIGTSGHAIYGFPAGTPQFESIEYSVQWVAMPETGFNCYASMMLYWEGAGGYMGSQFHSDGTQIIDFAIWDVNGTVKNSKPLGKCSRFGGEGEGSHCETTQIIKTGREYKFAVTKTFENSTGVAWGVTFLDVEAGVVHQAGSLFWDEAMSGTKLGQLKPSTISFQEYYTGGNFNSSVGFIGPVGIANGVKHLPNTAVCSSDDHHNCADNIPGVGSGRPNVLLYAGDKVPNSQPNAPIW
eukprot:TRINITY_DN3300_c4_g1_i1.p1 TRINITY_DN3300_c4_g1~~TRINITY_DN3300_c4_g1_i1.p1  ORF type:complete len:316 (+),score=53.53 TRINITY_DN3300_c4_g1_i1:40-948(+)